MASDTKWTTIRVSKQTKEDLDSIKHPGQTPDGMIQELIRRWKSLEELKKRVKFDKRPK